MQDYLPLLVIFVIVATIYRFLHSRHNQILKKIAPSVHGTLTHYFFCPCLKFRYQGLTCQIIAMPSHKRRKSKTYFRVESPKLRDRTLYLMQTGPMGSLHAFSGYSECDCLKSELQSNFHVFSEEKTKASRLFNDSFQQELFYFRESLERITVKNDKACIQLSGCFSEEEEYILFIRTGKSFVDALLSM